MSQTTGATESYLATRTVPAGSAAVFAVLSDPARHQETEPGDWVREAIDPVPITEVGQVFGINMFLEQAGGAYVMHNRVTALEPDRVIEWEPGQLDDSGQLDVGGWRWRYELERVPEGTLVRLGYDWSATPQAVRDEIGGLPPFGPELLERSLVCLERAATAS